MFGNDNDHDKRLENIETHLLAVARRLNDTDTSLSSILKILQENQQGHAHGDRIDRKFTEDYQRWIGKRPFGERRFNHRRKP